MKSFKDIRSKLTEEYYDGPTAYAAGDRTNVGDIAGTDLGSVQSGGANKPYPSSSNMDLMSKGLQAALGGVYEDVVDAVTRARAKFNATGLSFHIDPAAMRNAAMNGTEYTTEVTFGDQPLGDNRNVSDATDQEPDQALPEVEGVPFEATLPKPDVVFTFESSGTGYKINVNFA